jgi:simple sugar transport system permease protein
VGGACAGLAGAVEVVAVHGAANASLISGYGTTGILIAFAARFSPAGVVPVAILVGGIAASGSLLQRRLGLPDAAVLVLLGFAFVALIACETLRGRSFGFARKAAAPKEAPVLPPATAVEAAPAPQPSGAGIVPGLSTSGAAHG